MTPEEYQDSPERQVLYQALGTGVEVDVDIAEVRLADNDAMLLCTDGLIRALGEDEIAGAIDMDDVKGSARRLIHMANANEAPDNLSVILFGLRGTGEPNNALRQITEVMDRIFLFGALTPKSAWLLHRISRNARLSRVK